jgi:hypothetical protein
MAVAVTDIVRATVEARHNNQAAVQQVWHLRNVENSVSESDALGDVIVLLESVYTLLAAILNTLYAVQGVRVVNVTQNSDVGFDVFADATPGTNAQPNTALQVAYGLTLKTAKLNVNGRKFFGPVPEDQIDSQGVVAAGAILDLADVGDAVIVNQIAPNSTWQFGVISTLDDSWNPFTSYAISTTAVTQRRRRLGVGI